MIEPHSPAEMAAVGRRLRVLRLALGHTNQSAFAAMLPMGAPQWNNYEKGTKRPSIDEALKVVRLTGVSLDYIYRGIEVGLPADLVRRMRQAKREIDAQEPMLSSRRLAP